MADLSGRLARAARILNGLIADVQAWGRLPPIELKPTISEDRLLFRIVLQVNRPPPLEDWAYSFGEALHQLRASLDNFLVQIARGSGITDPKKLKRIQFPIAATQDEWRDNGVPRIAALPALVRNAVEQVQPFKRGESPDDLKGDLLLMLRDLSNQDKHQARVLTGLNVRELSQTLQMQFETDEGAAASVPPDATISMPSFETGGVLYEHRTKGRIAKVQGLSDTGFRFTSSCLTVSRWNLRHC